MGVEILFPVLSGNSLCRELYDQEHGMNDRIKNPEKYPEVVPVRANGYRVVRRVSILVINSIHEIGVLRNDWGTCHVDSLPLAVHVTAYRVLTCWCN